MGYYNVCIHGSLQSSRTRARNENSFAVVMTATISPPKGAVARADPNIRLKDYLECLRFYLSVPRNSIDRILFVDNSGSDLTRLERMVRSTEHDKVVELISFEGNDHPVVYGKAYGEFRLLDFALAHTQLVAETDSFWKVTGRLRLLNLSDMIASVHVSYDLLCDLHSFPIVGTGKLFDNHWMDLRVFSCSVKGYRALFRGKYEELGSHINQHTLYNVVTTADKVLRVIPRFPIQPILGGMSGRHDRDYLGGFQRIKTLIRAGARKIAPFVWI